MTITEQELFIAYANGDTDVVYSTEALALALADGFHRRLKAHLKKLQKKKYYYMLTFTLRDSTQDEDEVELYIIKQSKRTALQIDEFHHVKEYTKKGVAHWHVAIVTTKPLKKDRFNYYIQKFGTLDISKNKAQNIDEMLNYMTKTNNIKKEQL